MVVNQLLLWKASIKHYERLPWLLISHSSTYQNQRQKEANHSKKVIATIKYHWIDIQSKDFDGGLSTPTVEGLNKTL
jgi:hypothetical protein